MTCPICDEIAPLAAPASLELTDIDSALYVLRAHVAEGTTERWAEIRTSYGDSPNRGASVNLSAQDAKRLRKFLKVNGF